MPKKRPPTKDLSPAMASAWQHLIEISVGIREIAPWEVFSPNAVLGVRDPVSGDMDWCNVMGQDGDVFGVAVYSGDAGYATLHRILNDEIDEFDVAIAQRAVTLTFESASTAIPATKQLMKQLDRKFRGSNAWPEVLTHEPGLLPRLPHEEAQLDRLANALCGLAAMAPWACEDPDGGACTEPDHYWATEFPFSERERFLAPEPQVAAPVVVLPPFDQLAAARIRQSTTSRNGQWYLDWFCSITTIDDPKEGPPYFPAHLVCLDLTSGTLIRVDITKIDEAVHQLQAIVLREGEKRALPERILVRRQDLHIALQPVANALGISLELEPELAELSHNMQDQLLNFLAR